MLDYRAMHVAFSEKPAVALDPRSLHGGAEILPRFSHRIRAGFPSPAADYVEPALSLSDHLIVQGHEDATFILRVEGHSMFPTVQDGDEIIVDRALTAKKGSIVVAIVNAELTIKRIGEIQGKVALIPDNPRFTPYTLKDGETLEVWGVVTRCLRFVR